MTTRPEEENYIFMPINYLAYLKNFDGVFNILNDNARDGSVKYIFDPIILQRIWANGYQVKFKRRQHIKKLAGYLIFSRDRLDAL